MSFVVIHQYWPIRIPFWLLPLFMLIIAYVSAVIDGSVLLQQVSGEQTSVVYVLLIGNTNISHDCVMVHSFNCSTYVTDWTFHIQGDEFHNTCKRILYNCAFIKHIPSPCPSVLGVRLYGAGGWLFEPGQGFIHLLNNGYRLPIYQDRIRKYWCS